MVTESGCDVPNESSLPPGASLADPFRVDYYRGYLAAAMQAKLQDGVDLQVRALECTALPLYPSPTMDAVCQRS